MLDSIYVGMSGLVSFSKGLSNISNNVANLNTPGFKGSELEFLDLLYRYQYSGSGGSQSSPYSQGGGVKSGATTLKFTQGDFRQTGNDLDVAIDGNGFFVLRKDGQTLYARAGQFVIDEAGFLTSRDDGAKVAGILGGGLADISIAGKRSIAAKATNTVTFSDSLSIMFPSFDVTNITVYDSLGVQHTATLHLVNNSAETPGRWTFTLAAGTTVLTTGEVRYDGSGSPTSGFEKHTFSFDPKNGAEVMHVTLDFTGSNAFSSSVSSLRAASQDGRAAGFLSKVSIDSNGHLILAYSNGETAKADRVALAWFDNLSALQPQGNMRFSVFGDSARLLGAPGESSLGQLRTGGVELSNVDLAQEFSELIIVQRGYQASSQIISAANEMIQQLGEIRGRR